jgi:3-deoxy-manno-octulosonate cytidylyltransferase (CMP-KDO synthetase)
MPTSASGSDFAIVIPARFASSRFPGKPLADIRGKPMIRHVWEKCIAAAGLERVYVATDDARIADACEGFGARVLTTSSDCLTGTDRVAEAARTIDCDFIVNVQGDEPMLHPPDILRLADAFRASRGAVVVNGMTPILDESEYWSRTVPKVVAAPDGRLLYMSRAGVPANKAGTFVGAKKQVCIYCFSREQLERFAAAPAKGDIERTEDIEILRFLEMGIEVRMVELTSATIAVDTPEDLERVVNALRGE